MLDELESQNDDQASEMSKKVKMLKDVGQTSYSCGELCADFPPTVDYGYRRRDPRQHRVG